jgi:hypothetical protein
MARFYDVLKRDGLPRAIRQFYWWYAAFYLALTSRFPLGENIYNDDWDMLIVLDACRVDALRQMSSHYPWLSAVQSRVSVGSHTKEWVAKTFTKAYMREIRSTTYVTANYNVFDVLMHDNIPESRQIERIPFVASSYNYVNIDDFHAVDPVWEYIDHNAGGGLPPHAVTERAVHIARNDRPERMIVHYVQPHGPYIAVEEDIKKRIRNNTISRDELYNAYIENLRLVLDEVALLINNVDAENVVITADHGEALYDWGPIYGHNIASPQPQVKLVPWVTTKAEDRGNFTPELRSARALHTDEINQMLADLGYA